MEFQKGENLFLPQWGILRGDEPFIRKKYQIKFVFGIYVYWLATIKISQKIDEKNLNPRIKGGLVAKNGQKPTFLGKT